MALAVATVMPVVPTLLVVKILVSLLVLGMVAHPSGPLGSLSAKSAAPEVQRCGRLLGPMIIKCRGLNVPLQLLR